jgi:hypothetical protein
MMYYWPAIMALFASEKPRYIASTEGAASLGPRHYRLSRKERRRLRRIFLKDQRENAFLDIFISR